MIAVAGNLLAELYAARAQAYLDRERAITAGCDLTDLRYRILDLDDQINVLREVLGDRPSNPDAA